MSKLAKALTAAAGNAGESLYAEDVFSTYLYTGADANETVTNGIDLAGEGGFVWMKPRTTTGSHLLFDTERGTGKYLVSSSTAAEATYNPYLSSFNSDGFTTYAFAPADYASWTFRKAEKFFDVVTYTGNGVAGRTVAHNLGSTPAAMIVKRTNAAQGWAVYHVGMDATNPENWMMRLNAIDARFDLTPSRLNDTAPTSTDFTLSDNDEVNGNGDTYVAYLFASDAGGFGDDGSESIIKCGSYTGAGSEGSPEVTLGWEPQWLLIKNASSGSTNWVLVDSMRGLPVGSDSEVLYANTSGSTSGFRVAELTATGFKLGQNISYINQSGDTYIYIAIRRPMKTPESGTEVFAPVLYTGDGSSPKTVSGAGFAPDALWQLARTGSTQSPRPYDKLRGTRQVMSFNSQSAEFLDNYVYSLTNDGAEVGGVNNSSGVNYATYFFKRAHSFFDIVCYTGDGASTKTITHGLGVTPELAIVKRRNVQDFWAVAHKDYLPSYNSVIDSTNGFIYDASRYIQNLASSTFRVGTYDEVNASGSTYVAYLYATLAGVSKVGSYTGTGSNIDVDCGFSAGARFILIKGGSGGNWYVWDSARGIVAGNDPYQVLNSAANDVTSTDYIDPLSSGFTVTSSAPADMNTSGQTYIFLAIA